MLGKGYGVSSCDLGVPSRRAFEAECHQTCPGSNRACLNTGLALFPALTLRIFYSYELGLNRRGGFVRAAFLHLQAWETAFLGGAVGWGVGRSRTVH